MMPIADCRSGLEERPVFKRILAIVGLACLTGCASLVTPADPNGPLRLALTEPTDSLTLRADAGDKAAQYALSFLTRYGARGVLQDQVRSEQLRAFAAQPSSTTITQYIPGINGGPGRTSLIPITMPGISDLQARRMDLCGLTLLARTPSLGMSMCGSSQAYMELIPAAAAALAESGQIDLSDTSSIGSASIDPTAITTCEATDPLWRSAIRQFEATDYATAATGLDRIIALCGEAQPSWHPRVMRALIATQQGDPKAAIAFLAPVPRPAPAPIGGYVGFVAMQAQAATGDWNAYRLERDTLSAASLAAVKAEPRTKPAGEPFTVRGARVELFDRRFAMARGLDAIMTGLVMPGDERTAPVTYYVTMSPEFETPSRKQYFLDEYRCDGRSTLMYFGALDQAPDVATVRGLIEKRLSGDLEPTSGSSFDRGLSACQFPAQVAPGLGDS